MEEEIIIDEAPDKLDFLSQPDNATASIILVEKAVEQYQNVFKKLNVPYSYIGFFCSEFNKYSGLFTNKLKEYYDSFVKHNIKSEDLIDVYAKSRYSQHQGVKVKKNETFLCFDSNIILSFTKEMRQVKNLNMSTMVENIINICSKIDHQDELIGIVDLYEQYMINQFLKGYTFKLTKKALKEQEEAKSGSKFDPSEKLTGKAIEDIYQAHGKITRVVVPKLNLPTTYPVDFSNSRLIQNKRASKFVSPAKQIVFINRKKIVAVKYSSAFILKRKEDKNKKPFNWDF